MLSNDKFYKWIVEDRKTISEEVNTLNYSQGFKDYSYNGKFITDNSSIYNTETGEVIYFYKENGTSCEGIYFLPDNQNVLFRRIKNNGTLTPSTDYGILNLYLKNKEVKYFYDYYCIDFSDNINCLSKQLQIAPDGKHFTAVGTQGEIIYSSIPIDTTVSVESRNFINNNILQCFPNPMENEAVLYFHSDFEFNSANIEIFNNIGLKVKLLQKDIAAGENKISIDTEKLPNGIYFIRLLTNDRVYYTKAMVRK